MNFPRLRYGLVILVALLDSSFNRVGIAPRSSVRAQCLSQELCGQSNLRLSNGHRTSCGNDSPSVDTTAWPKIDDPVSNLRDIHVMFDHYHAVPFLNQSLQHVDNSSNIVYVQPSRWFV